MKKQYDIAIIGGGIGGLMAAWRLSERAPSLSVALFEKGSPIEKRVCPIITKKVSTCVKCKSCAIMEGLAGAGAFSDGKYVISTEYGGWLTEFLPDETVLDYIEQADQILVKFGATTERFQPSNELKKRCLEYDLHMSQAQLKHLGTDSNFETMRRLRERGDYRNFYIVDFPHLLQKTDFPQKMREILKLLSDTYEYPVDIEFTANFKEDGSYRINLLQCRPLQTKGLGRNVTLPELKDEKDCLFFSQGNFMGGNVRLPVNYVIYVDVKPYLALNEQERYEVARTVGCLNEKLKDEHTLLIGPGRWGTTTTSLGVPVHFTELCHMTAICEVSCKEEGLMPELSYGSHFFQDLVESDVFYVALFKGEKGVIFQEEQILEKPNLLKELTDEKFSQVIHVIKTEGMELYSDTIHQKVLCR